MSAPSSASAAEQFWKVPVLYVTDRQPQGDSYGPKRLPELDTVSGVGAGTVEMSLPVNPGFVPADWQKDGFPIPKTAAGTTPKIKPFACKSTDELKSGFDAALLQQLDQCTRKEIFVFVHGYNITFENAAQNAANLELYTGCPVVLYSWPSVGKLYRYSADECNNEWSQEHFNEFLEHLRDLKISKNIKVSIVAHSMGNRLFVRATPIVKGTALFSDVFMVNPDFDAQTFIHYLSRYIPKDGLAQGVRGQILVSRKDKALSVAEGVFGGYTRLGQGVDFSLSALLKPNSFSNVWALPGGNVPELDKSPQQKEAEMQRAASLKRAVRVVDVTALDHGLIGHKVPHEYIAWMHFRDRPPEGFELQNDVSRGCNRMSAFFARACGQKIAPPQGDFLIVTKSSGGQAAAKEEKDVSVVPANAN